MVDQVPQSLESNELGELDVNGWVHGLGESKAKPTHRSLWMVSDDVAIDSKAARTSAVRLEIEQKLAA